jgi:hypothetical protein
MYVPQAALADCKTAEIVFEMSDAQAPSLLGGSDDTRELGVWLSSLLVFPLLGARPRKGQ